MLNLTLLRFIALTWAFAQTPSPKDTLERIQHFQDTGYQNAKDHDGFQKVYDQSLQMAKDAVSNVDPAKVDPKDAYYWAQLYSMINENKPVFDLSREFLTTEPDPKLRFGDQMLLMNSCVSLGEMDLLEQTISDTEPVDWQDMAMLATYATEYVMVIANKKGDEEGLHCLDVIEKKIKFPDPKTEAQKMLDEAKKTGVSPSIADKPGMTDDQRLKNYKSQVTSGEQGTEFSFATERAKLLTGEGKKQAALDVLAKFDAIKDMNPIWKGKADSAAIQIKFRGTPEINLAANKTVGSFSGLASLKGKVVMLDFFAHWCHPCMDSVPGMVKLYGDLHSQGLEIVGVTEFYGYFGSTQGVSQDDEFAKLQGLLQEKNMTWPIVVGPKSNSTAYGVYGIPETVLIDKKGVIRDIKVGYVPHQEDSLQKEIEALIKE
jgi:thiol-disulfide isomerase/thioredoxin